ncbi:MAG: hypothetical protein ACHQUA_02780 [Microgenomates group bacterium]
MSASPELKSDSGVLESLQQPKEEFIVPETLQQQTGIKAVQKNFQAQVNDDKGQPVIQTPPTQVITVTPPAPQATLTTWAKGPITSSLTWLSTFWLRVIKKAIHFGWNVNEGTPQNSNQ